MGTQPEKTTFEIFPGINIDPGKIADTLQGAALFFRALSFPKTTVVEEPLNKNTEVTADTLAEPEAPIRTDLPEDKVEQFTEDINSAKSVETETPVEPKADLSKEKSEPQKNPEGQIDFTTRIEKIKNIEDDPELSEYLSFFMEKAFLDWIPVYAKETKKIANLKKWNKAFSLSTAFSISLRKGQGPIEKLEEVFLNHFNLNLNQALNIGGKHQEKRSLILTHKSADSEIGKALAKINNLKDDLILAKAFLAFIENKAPARGKMAFCTQLGFHGCIFNQFNSTPIPKQAGFSIEKAHRVALMLEYSLEQAIEEGLESTGETLGDFPPKFSPPQNKEEKIEKPPTADEPIIPPAKPGHSDNKKNDTPVTETDNLVVFLDGASNFHGLDELKNYFVAFVEKDFGIHKISKVVQGRKEEAIEKKWLEELRLDLKTWKIIKERGFMRIDLAEEIVSTINKLRQTELNLNDALLIGRKIVTKKSEGKEKFSDPPLEKNGEDFLSLDEQAIFRIFIKSKKDAWIETNSSTNKAFLSAYKINKSTLKSVLTRAKVNQASSLIHKIAPDTTLDQVLKTDQKETDLPATKIEPPLPDLLTPEEQRQFAAYLDFFKNELWRPEKGAPERTTFYTAIMGKDLFAKLKEVPISRRDAQRWISQLDSGEQLEEALETGQKELEKHCQSQSELEGITK